MEGNRLVHHEQRLSVLLFMHAHVGQGKQVLQGHEKGIRGLPDVNHSGMKGYHCAFKGFHKNGGKR